MNRDPNTIPLTRPLKVLLVEDSVADAEINVLTLQSAGLKALPRRVETELDYLLALREEPDVVLCAYALSSFDLKRALKILRDQNRDTPFIVVSGRIGEAAAVALMKEGANDFVRKDDLARLPMVVRREILQADRQARKRRSAEKAQRGEDGHDTLLKNLPGMVYRLRSDGGVWRFDFASEGCLGLTGYGPDALTGRDGLELSRLLYGDMREPHYESLRRTLETAGSFTLEHRILCANGDVKWVWHRGTTVMDRAGKPQYVEGFVADVTAQKVDQTKLDYLAHHDVLTGLANRAVFEEQLSHSLARVKRHFQNVTLLFVDLDNFKEVNDSFGHQCGDAVLRTIAGRLMACCRKGDVVARLGGDEFAVVMDDNEKTEDVAQFVPRLLEEVARPIKALGREVQVSASVGIAVHPVDGEDMGELIRNADAAMYAAKQGGRNTFRFFTKKLNDRARSMVVMRDALQRALRKNDFELHFQPEIRLSDRRVMAVEALARWKRSGNKLMTAEHFIPFAVDAGVVPAIDRWVLRAACRQATEWAEAGIPYNRIGVNLASQTLSDPKLAQELASVMKEFGVSPDWLEIEVSEAAFMQDTIAARVTLEKIDELGVTLTLDDFGRGYAGLNLLQRFPIGRIKLDRKFTKGLPVREEDVQFCRAVLAMAESLRIEVVAEGVERKEQEVFLHHAGCQLAQGNLFSKPLSAFECMRLLGDSASLPEPGKPLEEQLEDPDIQPDKTIPQLLTRANIKQLLG
ncbi:MAG: putative bifunctional diguanylate cyclase/phosphodiesterase [Bacillota bacterium]